ncbi:MAG: phage tail tube protein [Paracoccaceae bacterium]
MPDPISWTSKIILCKIESSYGVDAAPTGADNAMLLTNVELRPMEGEEVSRDLERPYFGAQPMIPTGLRATLTGSIELAGSGAAGTAPAWGPLARACGLAEVVTPATDVVYTPISDAIESVTIHFWVGGTRHVLKGTRGTGVIELNAQGLPVLKITMTGLFATPTEVARATVDLSDFMPPVLATTTNTPVFTLNAVSLVLRSLMFDLGNQVEPRLLIGREDIRITDRAEKLSAKVEAVPLTTFDPYTLAQAQTQFAAALTHGTVAGSIVSLAAPKCQMKRLTGYENNQNVAEWPLEMVPLPDAGNDQFTLTLT